MESLIFLTEKRDGIIKGQDCTNVIIPQDWKNKEEVSIPTVALESLILTSVIDAYKGR